MTVENPEFHNGDLVLVEGEIGVWKIDATRPNEKGVPRYVVYKAPDLSTQQFCFAHELTLIKRPVSMRISRMVRGD